MDATALDDAPTPVDAAQAPPAPSPTRAPDDLLRLVSKTSAPLPPDYVPPDLEPLPAGFSEPAGLLLRHDAKDAFVELATAARAQHLTLVAVSTYRSFLDQARVYQDEVQLFGKVQADRESAQPGRSEHELGTAADISSPGAGYQLDDNFEQRPEGAWLAQHAWEYGFVLSYPAGEEQITGYRYEPWHFRYVGQAAARYITFSGLTSTEVLGAYQTVGADPTGPVRPARTVQPGCGHFGPIEDGC